VLALGGLLVGQLLEGGHLSSLVQPAAFVIVAVGTVGAVLLQSGMPDFLRGVRMACFLRSYESGLGGALPSPQAGAS
jgi:chemotaxis protein MotA